MDLNELLTGLEKNVESSLQVIGGSVPADQAAEMMQIYYYIGQRHILKMLSPLKKAVPNEEKENSPPSSEVPPPLPDPSH